MAQIRRLKTRLGRRGTVAPPARLRKRRGITRVTQRDRVEFEWLATNHQQYAGRWVALDGDALLAVGDSLRGVYAALAGHKGTPLVTYVERENEPGFAGW